jgi:hypothetical protein
VNRLAGGHAGKAPTIEQSADRRGQKFPVRADCIGHQRCRRRSGKGLSESGRRKSGSALRVLGTFSCFVAAVLFALDFTWVARQHAVFPKHWAQTLGASKQSPRDPMANRVRLGRYATAPHAHNRVELAAGFSYLERLQDPHSGCIPGKIIFQVSLVNQDLTGTRDQPNAGYRRFASAGTSNRVLALGHRAALSSRYRITETPGH